MWRLKLYEPLAHMITLLQNGHRFLDERSKKVRPNPNRKQDSLDIDLFPFVAK